MPNLETLDIAINEINTIENLEEMGTLEELWLNNNKIESLDNINTLSHLPNLKTIYLDGNPIAKQTPNFKDLLRTKVPTLKEIDGEYLKPKAILTLI